MQREHTRERERKTGSKGALVVRVKGEWGKVRGSRRWGYSGVVMGRSRNLVPFFIFFFISLRLARALSASPHRKFMTGQLSM